MAMWSVGCGGGGGVALCEGAMEQRGMVAHKQTAVLHTLNISGLRSDFPHLHTDIPCLLKQFLAFEIFWQLK